MLDGMRAIGLARLSTFYGLMLGVALLAGALRGELAMWLPGFSLMAWGTHAALGLVAGLGIVAITRVTAAHFTWAAALVEEFRGIVGELPARQAALMAVASGIAEEALFRGVLQPTLGLFIGAAIFGLLHIGPTPRFLPWTIMAFGSGLLFGAMVHWTGDLVGATVAHATVNFLNLKYLGAREGRLGIELAAGWH
jgi:uncharacterized protein